MYLSCSMLDLRRTHEDLQARSKEQDEQLASILHHFDNLRVESKIDGWVRRAENTLRINEDGDIGERGTAATHSRRTC